MCLWSCCFFSVGFDVSIFCVPPEPNNQQTVADKSYRLNINKYHYDGHYNGNGALCWRNRFHRIFIDHFGGPFRFVSHYLWFTIFAFWWPTFRNLNETFRVISSEMEIIQRISNRSNERVFRKLSPFNAQRSKVLLLCAHWHFARIEYMKRKLKCSLRWILMAFMLIFQEKWILTVSIFFFNWNHQFSIQFILFS